MEADRQSEFDAALATTAAPEPEPGDRERIEATLLDAGVCPPPGLVVKLDNLVDRFTYERTAEAMRHILPEDAGRFGGGNRVAPGVAGGHGTAAGMRPALRSVARCFAQAGRAGQKVAGG